MTVRFIVSGSKNELVLATKTIYCNKMVLEIFRNTLHAVRLAISLYMYFTSYPLIHNPVSQQVKLNQTLVNYVGYFTLNFL